MRLIETAGWDFDKIEAGLKGISGVEVKRTKQGSLQIKDKSFAGMKTLDNYDQHIWPVTFKSEIHTINGKTRTIRVRRELTNAGKSEFSDQKPGGISSGIATQQQRVKDKWNGSEEQVIDWLKERIKSAKSREEKRTGGRIKDYKFD